MHDAKMFRRNYSREILPFRPLYLMNILFVLTHCPEIKNIGSNIQKCWVYNAAVFNVFNVM